MDLKTKIKKSKKIDPKKKKKLLAVWDELNEDQLRKLEQALENENLKEETLLKAKELERRFVREIREDAERFSRNEEDRGKAVEIPDEDFSDNQRE